MKTKVVAIFVLCLILCSFMPCFAANAGVEPSIATDIVETANPPYKAPAAVEATSGSLTTSKDLFSIGSHFDMLKDYEPVENSLPNVSVDELGERVNKKGVQIMGLVQKFCMGVAVFMFFASALVCAFTWFGNHEKFWLGIGGCFISAVLYVVFVYGASIVHLIGGFLVSP